MAACKLISLTEKTTEKERKMIDKEMKVHAALKHQNVLEFINAVAVEPRQKQQYVPGIYMLLEFAAGGDLFDKIGELARDIGDTCALIRWIPAPDVGVCEEVAQIYFKQLATGMVGAFPSCLTSI